jgi:hypothetical protein
MLAFFLILFFVPLLGAAVAFLFLRGISLKEFGAIAGLIFLIAGASALIVSWAKTHDKEIWNGTIVDKKSVSVSCSHSYECNCKTKCTKDANKNENCRRVCQTCYDHSNDWDWRLYTSNNETIEIDRVDRQGASTPSRWSSAFIGEATALSRSYTNYIKGAPEAIFQDQTPPETYVASLPEYPINTYDYYRLDRVLTVGLSLPEHNLWNQALTQLNAELGAKKQVNIVLILVKGYSRDWFEALVVHWLGGKKNDVILVVGVDDALEPQWVDVMAWTTNESFKSQLREAIRDLPTLSQDAVIRALRTQVSESYQRKPMKDFEYLRSVMKPSTLQWWLTLLICLLCTAGLLWIFERKNPFDESRDESLELKKKIIAWLHQKNPLRKPGSDQ